MSAVIWTTTPRQAVHRAFATENIICSADTRNELRDVIRREKFDRYAPLADRLAAAEEIIAEMIPVMITETIDVCRDIGDNKILSLAVSGKADIIITGDLDLLVLHPFRGIAILTPGDYLALDTVD